MGYGVLQKNARGFLGLAILPLGLALGGCASSGSAKSVKSADKAASQTATKTSARQAALPSKGTALRGETLVVELENTDFAKALRPGQTLALHKVEPGGRRASGAAAAVVSPRAARDKTKSGGGLPIKIVVPGVTRQRSPYAPARPKPPELRKGAYNIASTPSFTGKYENGRARFDLPSSTGFQDGACYAVTIAGTRRILPPKGGEVGLNFDRYDDLSRAASPRDLASGALRQLESESRARDASYKTAEATLNRSPAYRGGQCKLPKTGALPRRPATALAPAEASKVADEILIQHWVNRYTGGGLQCNGLLDALRQEGFLSEVNSFLARRKCAYAEVGNLYPVDSLTGVADWVEERAVRCAAEDDSSLWCKLTAGTILATRYKSDHGKIMSRFAGDYSRYRQSVKQVREKPYQEMESCETAVADIASYPKDRERIAARLPAARQALLTAERRFEAARAQRASTVIKGRDLLCRKDEKSLRALIPASGVPL